MGDPVAHGGVLVVTTESRLRKIAIFGTTPTRMEGPVQDDSGWERWTIGPGGKDMHNWDRLYEVHTVWPEDFKGYLNDLSNEKREVWSLVPLKPRIETWWKKEHQKTDAQLAQEITGPFATNKVIDRDHLLDTYGSTWMSSSISWLMAHALDEHLGGNTVAEIGLWGIDLESGEEYIPQYIGCRHFIDLFRVLNVKVTLPSGSGLERELRYYPARFETVQALHMERKQKTIQAMLQQCQVQQDQARIALYRKEGELIALQKHQAPQDVLAPIQQEILQANVQVESLTMQLAQLHGEANGTEYWRKMYVYGLRDPDAPPL